MRLSTDTVYRVAVRHGSDSSEWYCPADLRDPLDWRAPVAVFFDEDSARSFATQAYEVLSLMLDDWKTLSVRVVRVWVRPSVIDGGEAYGKWGV